MLFGSVGQTLTMVLLAILGSIDNSATQIVSAVLLFVFNSFFAVGWLVEARCFRRLDDRMIDDGVLQLREHPPLY